MSGPRKESKRGDPWYIEPVQPNKCETTNQFTKGPFGCPPNCQFNNLQSSF